jgi:hypothetical protein
MHMPRGHDEPPWRHARLASGHPYSPTENRITIAPPELLPEPQPVNTISQRLGISITPGREPDSRTQPTAFFTSAAILASSLAVSPFSAKEVGHMAPSSRFAVSLKPNVAYRALNFAAL